MCKYRELTKKRDALIDQLEKLATEGTSVTNPKANAIALIIAIRELAGIQSILSDLADLQTRRIVRLTWVLVALTSALLIFTAYLYQDTHALIQREKARSPELQKNP
jgi:hypothetical protein